MKITMIPAKDYIPDYVNEIRQREKVEIKGVIYCEGSVAQQYMFDSNTPGNVLNLHGCEFKSQFTEFCSVGHGIGCSTGITTISVYGGKINGIGVLFIHPTSAKVDHTEVENYFKEHFPEYFFKEFDQNFHNKWRDVVREDSGHNFEEILRKTYSFVIDNDLDIHSYANMVVEKILLYIHKVTIENEDKIKDAIYYNNQRYGLGTKDFYTHAKTALVNIINM